MQRLGESDVGACLNIHFIAGILTLIAQSYTLSSHLCQLNV